LPQPHRLDFGPTWKHGVAAYLPPHLGEPYQTFVAAVDADGNEVAGLRLPDVTVPLGTYMGWNPRHPSQGAPEQSFRTQGSTIPFPPTSEAREQSGDPRRSIAERYASRESYGALIAQATEALIAAGYVLAEDRDDIMQRALWRYDLFTASH